MSMSQVQTPIPLEIGPQSHLHLPFDHSYHTLNQYLATTSTYHNYVTSEQNMMAMAYLNTIYGEKNKIKTSLCKKWAESGYCPYGYKCQFAHGIAELRCNVGEISYKTKQCHAFVKKGYCPYGDRCNFLHRSLKNMFEDFQANKQSQSDFQNYREVIQMGKLAQFKRSKLIDILNNQSEQSDKRSVSSTEESRSQNLSRSREDLLLNQFSEQNGSSYYNYTTNISYGNIAEENICNQMLFFDLQNQKLQHEDEKTSQIEQGYEVEDEGKHLLFNTDKFS